MTKKEVVSKIKKLIVDGNEVIYVHSADGSFDRLYLDEVDIKNSHISHMWSDYHFIDIIGIYGSVTRLVTTVNFGSDPELFMLKGRDVIVANENPTQSHKVVPDGFQYELHSDENSCRQLAAKEIGSSLMKAFELADVAGCKLDFSVGKKIGENVWKKTNDETKRFGCNPTESIYEPKFKRPTGRKIRFRSSGGHIHIECELSESGIKRAIKVADIICGSLFVLIDRDKENVLRRKYYGRAGEYRLKPYGFEYRVLSNYWLRSYVLWSLAAAQLRTAVAIVEEGIDDKLLKYVDMSDVKHSINKNNLPAAKRVFSGYKKFIKENIVLTEGGIDITNVDKVERWLLNRELSNYSKRPQDVRQEWKPVSQNALGQEGFEKTLNSLPNNI